MEVALPHTHAPKRELCAICCAPRATEPFHLGHGIVLQLCMVHREIDYLRRDHGRVLVRRLTDIWAAHQLLTSRRRNALTTHLRRIRDSLRAAHLPGSYAWRRQREEAERRFGAGEDLATVIRDVRDGRDWGHTSAPSVRTIRRWYNDARWLTPPVPRAPRLRAALKADADRLAAMLEATPINATTTFSLHERPTPAERRRRRGLS